MKKVIYTCIVGEYDILRQPVVVKSDYDYICFTNDNRAERVGIWQIREIPYENDNKLRKSRYVKLLPHNVLKDYSVSIWIDANIQILNLDFYNYIEKAIENNVMISQLPHLKSNCIYDEIRNAFYGGKVNAVDAVRQYSYLRKNKFPKDYGLFENNIILRMHNLPFVSGISESWWREYCTFSERDQFSLMFLYWKFNFKPSFLIDESHNARNVECLRYYQHYSRNMSFENTNIVKKIIRSLYKKIIIKIFLS